MSIRTIAVGSVAAAAVAVAGISVVVAASGDDADDVASEPFSFEVAENATRFAFDEAPVFDDGMPGYGNPFVTEGYIYEAGTLADGGGVDPDGSPTHPDAVIGTWICEGTLIGDGARTDTGPWVVSTQVFDFDEFDGLDAVITSGVEISDVGEEVTRAIIGGTGEHVGAAGTQVQVLEGFNASQGVDLSITFEPAEG
jgi:hypothetical protein